MKQRTKNIYGILLIGLLLGACQDYTPKPYAYPRVNYPDKNYERPELSCPFSFEIPTYSRLEIVPSEDYKCWYNLKYLPFNATLHLSYRKIQGPKSLDSLQEDAYKMAFKHISRAEEIIEREYVDSSKNVFGMIYDLEGKTATPFNFYLTDRKDHFFRGSFYFNVKTDRDSVAPIYDFIREDIMRSIESFKWN